jgi:iron complex transport system substrate-binding protein
MKKVLSLWFLVVSFVAAQDYPVTVNICGESVVFEQAPERAVIFEANMLEIMLELGLDDHIAGVWTGDIPSEKVQPVYAERTAKLTTISEESWPPPGLEVVLGSDPDFVWSGWGYGFSEESGLTPETLAEAGITSYTVSESCARGGGKQTTGFDTLYNDILAAGAIFSRSDKAEVLVQSLKAEVTAIEEALGDVSDRVRVFNYDSGEDSPYTSGALSMPNTLIQSAGGTNIFADVQKDWMTVSWEEVVARDPDVILVSDTSWVSFEDNVAFLKSLPELADVSAVKNERFVPMTFKQATPGLENVVALRNIAKALYPERLE